jgi:Ni,Fe-hydrogenase III component G
MTQAVTPTRAQVPLTGFVGQALAALGDAVIAVERCDERRGTARIDPERTLQAAKKFFAMAGARLATATAIDVRDGVDVLYHWCFEPPGAVITLKVLAARPEIALDSVAQHVPAANWIEREMHDLLGVSFRDHPDMRRLILDDSWPEGVYPLRKDFDQVADRPAPPPVPPDPEEGQR